MARGLEFYQARTFAFLDRLRACTRSEAIGQAIVDEMAELGFTCVTCWTLPAPGHSVADGIMLNTRPTEYVERYIENDYAVRDPIVTHLAKTMATYSWGDVRAAGGLTRSQTDIIDEGREFRMRDGLIVPVVTPSGSLSLFSPCGERPDLSAAARSAVEIMGTMALQMLQRARLEELRETADYKPLTAREREILQWVAYGKNDDEIGKILNISAATVLRHVENAKRKLDTFKRTAAIINALRRGEIAL